MKRFIIFGLVFAGALAGACFCAHAKDSTPPWEAGSVYRFTGNTGNNAYRFNENQPVDEEQLKKKKEAERRKLKVEQERMKKCKNKKDCKYTPKENSEYIFSSGAADRSAYVFNADGEVVSEEERKAYANAKRLQVTGKIQAKDGFSTSWSKKSSAQGAAGGLPAGAMPDMGGMMQGMMGAIGGG
ncbi:MAG: hypothetical protein WCS77_09990, partial [Elusimicrobiaceae bacterium]